MPWAPRERHPRRRDDEIVAVRVAFHETDLRARALRLGAVWRPAPKLWEITWRDAKRLGIADRIVQTDKQVSPALTYIGAVAGYAAMALAIAVGVAEFMVADVRLALARIDADDSATWPNMAPQVRYFFIPVVAGAVVVAAVAVNLLLTLKKARLRPSPSTGF